MTCRVSLRFNVSPAFVAALTILTAFTPVAGRGDADLERSVGMMTRIAFCGSPVFSPDGTRLAFISNISGVPQVWTVDARGGWPTQVTALEDPVGGVDWSPDGAWLAVSVAPGGGMNSQIHLVRPDGTGMKRLTGGGRDNNWLGGFSHDGRLLTLSSNRDNPQAMDAFVYELSADRLRLVARNPGVGTLEDISRDGRWGILSRVRSRGDNDLFLVDLHTGSETLLTPHDPPGSFGGGTFSPDGAILYLTSNKGRDRTALSRIRMDEKGRPGPIETIAGRDDAEVQEFSIDDDGGSAAVVWNAAGRSELHFVDLSTLASRPAPALPAEIVYGLDLSRDGRLLAMTVSGAASPADVWVLDRAAGEIRRITTSPHAGVDLASLVRPE
ncbi:MAG TPA: hypothetical protein VFP98_06045, partial [Candidatus Polarisedimenticolia bacterium]|nr:hypothetical protein [Candidatus Polarisedimenticolia bacterium]